VEEALTPEQFRDVWNAKPSLRAVYRDYYRRLEEWSRPGMIVELGAGSGNLKEAMPEVVATDIVSVPWLDAVVDAQALPSPTPPLTASSASMSSTTSSTRCASSTRRSAH